MTRLIHQTKWRGISCSQLCLWILWPCWTAVKVVLHIQLKRHSKVTSSWANMGCIPKVTAKTSHRKWLKTGIWFVWAESALSQTPAESCCWQDSSDGEDIGVLTVHGKIIHLWTSLLVNWPAKRQRIIGCSVRTRPRMKCVCVSCKKGLSPSGGKGCAVK